MNGPALRTGFLRASLVAAGFTLGAVALGRIPAPAALRAAGMLALPCLLLAVLRREGRLLADAATRARPGPRRPGPAAPAPRKP